MPNFKKRLDEFLDSSRLLIETSLTDEQIKQAVKDYGYDETRLQSGKQLYDEFFTLYAKQKKEYGEQIEATEEVNAAWDTADQVYTKTLKIARVAFQKVTRTDREMIVSGSRKRTLAGWLEQTKIFYTNLLEDTALLTEMTKFGYTKEKLTAEYQLVQEVDQKKMRQNIESSEAEESTKARDQKIRELDQWISDYRAVLKVALDETPQKLERLGIKVRG